MSFPVRIAVLLAVVTLVSRAVAAGPEGRQPPPRTGVIRTLIVTGGHAFDQSDFFQMFEGQGDIQWIEARHPEAAQWFAPDKADEYDVMVWYDFGQKPPAGQDEKNLIALLEKGKPLLVLHHAISSYVGWPEMEKIVGARYVLKPEADHPGSTFKHDETLRVSIADRNHPITRFLDDFEIVDEIYGRVPMEPGIQPLLTTDHPGSMDKLAWTRTYRNSPVVFLQLGHGPTAFRHESFRRLLMQSIRWLAGALPDSSEDGFVPLFNGKDLDGWTVMGKPEGFRVKDGVIRSESGKGGEWIRTNQPYGNFILRVEWRVGMGGNAGVFSRAAIGRFPWLTGSEIQITNEYRDPWHCTGSLYGDVPADPRPDERADVWHEFEIQCRGPHILVCADDIPVVNVDARTVPILAGKPLTGFIGVQDSHNAQGYIEYRNIRIKELPMTKGATVWRLATQAYTFHKFTLSEAMDKAAALGLHLIEFYPGQALSPEEPDVKFDHNSSKELRDKVRQKLRETGLTVVNYGVVGLGSDEAENRKVFTFARDMDIETVVSEPEDRPEVWAMLDKLTQEYGVNLAIHNHPKPSHYWDPQVVLSRVKNLNPRIGACADTGHWLRSGINPLDAVRMLEGRIISSHLKDLSAAAPDAHDVVWGTGVVDMRALLAELDRQGFSGVFSIEYEHNWLNSMPEIAECIKFFNQVTQELSRQKLKWPRSPEGPAF